MTNFLSFVDDEINIISEANELFMLFHPSYAREGRLSRDIMHKLRQMSVMIFADNNIVSPICEIVRNGTLSNKERLRKIAAFVTLTKFINASITCGLALVENDTAGKAKISAEENRQLFLYGIDRVPSNIWKQLALGELGAIPSYFLNNYQFEPNEENYALVNELHFLCHKAAIIKIVLLLRSNEKDGFLKFYEFLNWYIDHLVISENIMAYAALVFGNRNGVAKPKNHNSFCLEKIIEGIENQAWDIVYLSQWSTFFYYEEENQVYMFATDDKTTKEILKNSLPPGKVKESMEDIFYTKKQKSLIDKVYLDKLGSNRKRPFYPDETEKELAIVKSLISEEIDELRNTLLTNMY